MSPLCLAQVAVGQLRVSSFTVRAVPNSSDSVNRVERGEYAADILQGSSTSDRFWYYVLQRNGSREIIDIARFDSKEEAMDAAREVIEKLHHAAAAE